MQPKYHMLRLYKQKFEGKGKQYIHHHIIFRKYNGYSEGHSSNTPHTKYCCPTIYLSQNNYFSTIIVEKHYHYVVHLTPECKIKWV